MYEILEGNEDNDAKVVNDSEMIIDNDFELVTKEEQVENPENKFQLIRNKNVGKKTETEKTHTTSSVYDRYLQTNDLHKAQGVIKPRN